MWHLLRLVALWATAAKQPAVLSAARYVDMMPGAVSRERHSGLVDGSDSRESNLSVGVSCPSHVQLFNVAPSAFGGTLAAAVLQSAILSASLLREYDAGCCLARAALWAC